MNNNYMIEYILLFLSFALKLAFIPEKVEFGKLRVKVANSDLKN